MEPADLHVTLVFLGARDAPPLPSALPPAGPLRAVGVRGLPRRRPHALAVVLEDPTGRCGALQAAVREALGAPAEDRPWLPHVTIARRRRGADGPVPRLEVPELVVAPAAVVLWASRTDPAPGPRYVPLQRVAL